MQRKILTYLCFVLMLFGTVSVSAKKKDPPAPPNNKNNVPPQGLPIDGGLSSLLIAGVVYGVYAIRKKFTIDD